MAALEIPFIVIIMNVMIISRLDSDSDSDSCRRKVWHGSANTTRSDDNPDYGWLLLLQFESCSIKRHLSVQLQTQICSCIFAPYSDAELNFCRERERGRGSLQRRQNSTFQRPECPVVFAAANERDVMP